MRRSLLLPLALVATVTAGCFGGAGGPSGATTLRGASSEPSAPSFDTAIHFEAARAAPREVQPNASYVTGFPGVLLRYVHGASPADAWIESPQGWRLLQQTGGWLLVGDVVEHRPAPSGASAATQTLVLDVLTTGVLPEGEYTVKVQCTVDDQAMQRTRPCDAPAEARFAIVQGSLVAR